MPQLFQVLRCFKCLVFQVHQTKKSSKFACKMCGEKQTIKRHYGLGNGQECRIHVQKLNGLRGEIDELNDVTLSDTDSNEESEPTEEVKSNMKINKFKIKSKWSNFVDKESDETDTNTEEPMFLGNTEVVLEVPAKRKKFVKPKAAFKTEPKNRPWDKTPITQNNIIPFTDNFFSESKDLHIIELNDKNTTVAGDTPLNDKIDIKEYSKPIQANKKSKWAQFAECEGEENKIQDALLRNTESNSETSSWVQGTDETNAFNRNEALKPKDRSQNNDTKGSNSIFSMCDESDLDSILDI